MRSKLNKLGLCLAVSMFSGGVFAVPLINSSDVSKINVPSGSEATDWYRSSNATELYVAPPTEGESFMSDYAPRNTSYCKDLKMTRSAEQRALGTYLLLSDQLNIMAVNYGQYEYVLDSKGYPVLDEDFNLVRRVDANGEFVLTEFGEQIKNAIKDRDDDQIQYDRNDALMTEAKRDSDEAKLAKDDARSNLMDCREDASFEGESWRDYCATEYEEYIDMRDLASDATAGYRAARTEYLNSEWALSSSQKVLNRLEDEVDRTRTRISSLETLIAGEQVKLKAMYNEFAGMFGGQINMTYRSKWGETINAFAQANPNKSIRRINVYNPFLSLPVSGEYAAGSPGMSTHTGLLWSSLNIGNVVVDKTFAELPDGSVDVSEKQGLAAWPGTFQGSVGVTVLNACAIVDGADGLSGRDRLAQYESNFSQYLQPQISYSFDVRADFGWDAEVNKADVLKVVEKITKKKGFFSSKSKHSINREFDHLSSFKISFNADARTDALNDEEKEELTDLIRSRLTKSVLDQVAQRVPVEQEQPAMVEVESPGATELSKKLRATCKFGWGYSCYGGWALYGLNSIFGNRTTQMSEYIENNDYRARESYRDSFFVKIDRGIAYTPR